MTTTHQDKLGAYNVHQQQEFNGREIDKRALLNCATRLNVALDDGGKDMKAYAEAIRLNQRLWTIFQVALCDPENQLPRELKTILLNLSRYVDRVSFRAVTEFAAPLLQSLIDINRTIAKGLNKNTVAQESVSPQQPAAPTVTSVMTSV